jgi:hypothetical protein
MMTLKEIQELNEEFKKNNNIAYDYNGTELQTLNGEHIGVDLMLSDEGLELQICKVSKINYKMQEWENGHIEEEKIWETFALESIDIDSIDSDEELEEYLQSRINYYEEQYKNDIDEEGFVINRSLANKIGGLEYKGIYVQYLYDTNTMVFTIDNKDKSFDDCDDIDCIVYRNETQSEIEKHIDNLVDDLIKRKKVEKVYHLKNTYNEHDEYTTDETKIIMIYIDEMAQCCENNISMNIEKDEYESAKGWLYDIMLLCGKYNRGEIDINEIIEQLNKEHFWSIEVGLKRVKEND